MKVIVYPSRNRIGNVAVHATLDRVAAGSDTQDLLVAVYLLPRSRWTGGTAWVRSWLTPQSFRPRRGKWRLVSRFPTPPTLPSRFKLIRLLLLDDPGRYPLQEEDAYGWQHRYATFDDHLAFLFAHELHHYRRYHCGLHPGEGENRANAWAVAHVDKLGYRVQSSRLPRHKQSAGRKTAGHTVDETLWAVMSRLFKSPEKNSGRLRDRRAELASRLQPGDRVTIRTDPRQRYSGQSATVLRRWRRNAYRIAITTSDGKQWRWPLAWLEL
ncbi:MAG TPA: hypothetical protein PKN24_12710 [bacterium]|nr:hypothetical protein [bacterium]